MAIEVPASGPRNAKIMIVGEAPGENEEEQGQPFVGYSGLELTRMLNEAGFNRSECYVTNVCRIRPPRNEIDRFFGNKTSKYPHVMGRYPGPEIQRGLQLLEEDIRAINPDLILAFGNTALWATTGQTSITKWRGSVLSCRELGPFPSPKVIPTYHPAAILRTWQMRFIAVEDLRRAKRELEKNGRNVCLPNYSFSIRPSFETVLGKLHSLRSIVEQRPTWLSVDIETQRRHIDCIGIGWSSLEAMCIPIIQMDASEERRFYWTIEEQTQLILALRELLTHPNCKVIGQNFPYDQQYIAREWGFIPNLQWDTMTIGHTIFPTMPKSLDFLSSLYCDFHRYWKEDAKDTETKHRLDDESHWTYNCRDCVVTYEVREKQEQLLSTMNFPAPGGETPQQRQMSFHSPVLLAMLQGVKVTTEQKQRVLQEVDQCIVDREKYVEKAVGHPLNPRSPQQLQRFFYTDMGIKQITHRKTGRPTTDETTLQRIAKRDPLLAPICEFVNDIRSLGTYRAVCSVPMDHDNRLRCSYVIPGTDTFRFASKEDAFGFGTNLQNITSGTSVSPDELDELIKKGFLIKPNLRKLFIPDLGFMLGEFDLPQADAQVVAWEAEDDILKAIFKDPERDLHSENAVAIFGRDAYIPGTSGIPSKKTIKPTARQYAKVGVHAADYGAQARTLASALGISTTMAEAFLDAWFKAHPNIKDWQNTVSTQIQTRRYVENRFGYRRYCFSRFEDDYKECLAWIPQSTVAIITNTGIREVTKDLRVSRQVHFLLQVHDSAVFQFPIHNAAQIAGEIKRLMTVPVPYPDPLIMVPDAKFSEISWGDAKKSAI